MITQRYIKRIFKVIPLIIITLFLSSLLSLLSCAFATKLDPSHYRKWLGPETCAECHEDEAAIWRNAHHATSFKKMPRSSEGKQIAKKLAVSRIKMSEECGVCHISYTLKTNKNRLQAIAGVSCESCHGPAKDWNELHQDYGGKHVTANQETASHKKQRWTQSEEAGMVRPVRRYKIFKQCFQCHTISDENLINKTNHPIGDKFELVKWSNGEVRHNVWHSKGKTNKIRPIEQQRVRFVMGQGLALEFSLRGLSEANNAGKYADAMERRAKKAIATLEKINSKISLKEVSEILSVAKATPLNYLNKDKLISAAEKISTLNQQLVDKHDGKALSAIDSMLPTKYEGKPTI